MKWGCTKFFVVMVSPKFLQPSNNKKWGIGMKDMKLFDTELIRTIVFLYISDQDLSRIFIIL